MGRDVFYITTPIYYPNDVPHIGHAYNAVATDFIARYHRLRGEEVFHLTGTDEHGLKLQRAAEAAGMSAAGVGRRRWSRSGARSGPGSTSPTTTTSGPRSRGTRRRSGRSCCAVYENGRDDIYLGHYEGLYCVSCELYYNEADLLPGELCPIHEIRSSSSRKTTTSSGSPRTRTVCSSTTRSTRRRSSRRPGGTRSSSVIRGGLQDFSISRTTFDWGVRLPWDETHINYVWFDALTNYITAAGYADDPDRFARVWPANIHSIGKDILRQHAVYWPAMLMAAGVEPPMQVWAHGFLTVGGKKMSKTNATGIHPFELIDRFGVDSYRWFFMREVQYGQDGSFSFEAMVDRHNADLANGLGNLASRVLAMLGDELRRGRSRADRRRVGGRPARR